MKEPITVARAAQVLESVTSYQRDQTTLQVEVFQPGAIGGTPRVQIIGMQAGFDWDHGAILLRPEKHLTILSTEEVRAITDSARKGQSWHAYQAQKRLHERIRSLEAELAALKQGGA